MNLGRAGGIRTVIHDLAFGFDYLSPTVWTGWTFFVFIEYFLQKAEFLFLASALALDRFDDLGYHLARPLDNNCIANTDVLAPDVIFIV